MPAGGPASGSPPRSWPTCSGSRSSPSRPIPRGPGSSHERAPRRPARAVALRRSRARLDEASRQRGRGGQRLYAAGVDPTSAIAAVADHRARVDRPGDLLHLMQAQGRYRAELAALDDVQRDVLAELVTIDEGAPPIGVVPPAQLSASLPMSDRRDQRPSRAPSWRSFSVVERSRYCPRKRRLPISRNAVRFPCSE